MDGIILALGRIFNVLGIFCILFLTGCDDQIWNNPYPNFAANANNLYTAFTIQPKTLDPAKAYSENELVFIAQIYEPPYEYAYLARPYTLQPLTTTNLATPRYDAKRNISTYRIQIKPGIMYQPHPAFAQHAENQYLYHNLSRKDTKQYKTLKDFKQTGTRELTAADYVYEIKRLADPKINSPVFGFLQPYIIGIEELRNELAATYKVKPVATELDMRDYNLSGVRIIDNYTYEIDIHGQYPQFKYWLAMPFFGPMPWEVIKLYAQPGLLEHNISIDWYPVGTGAYYLTENNPDRRMVMERNPNYHPDFYPSTGTPEDIANGFLTMAGQRMPFIDKVVFSLEKESIPYWDKFMQGYYDRSGISADNFTNVVSGVSNHGLQLNEELLERGLRLNVADSMSTVYWGFNMLDTTVGGYSESARKLRKAIALAFDIEEFLVIFANGRGTLADGPLPPGIFGYEPPKINSYSDAEKISQAKQLLAEAGYADGVNQRTGQPLQIYFDAYSSGDPDEKSRFAWITKQLAKINIELIVRATDYNRFMEKMDQGNAQLFLWAWGADYPDPENFLFMFYSKNGKVKFGGENASNYSNPKFDVLYERFKHMEDTPERLELIQQMLSILRVDAPWIWGYSPQLYTLSNPWTGKGKPSAMANNVIKYASTNGKLRAELQKAWNKPIFWPLILCIVVLLIILAPAFIAYRRRERATVKRTK